MKWLRSSFRQVAKRDIAVFLVMFSVTKIYIMKYQVYGIERFCLAGLIGFWMFLSVLDLWGVK